MGQHKDPKPYDPAGHWRCIESGSNSVKYATGHDSTSDQVLHAAKVTGRKHKKTMFATIRKSCGKFFRRIFRKCPCANKRNVKTISTRNENESANIVKPCSGYPTNDSTFNETVLEETVAVPKEEIGSDDSSFNETSLEETVAVPKEESGSDDSSFNETSPEETVAVPKEESGSDDYSFNETSLEETVAVPKEESGSDDYSFNETSLEETVAVPKEESGSDDSSFNETSLEETVAVPKEESVSDDSSFNETSLEKTVAVPTVESDSDDSSFNETALEETVPVPTEESGYDDSSFSKPALEKTVPVPTEESGSDDSSFSETALEKTVPVPTEESGSDDSSFNETVLEETVPVPTEESGSDDSSFNETALEETVPVPTEESGSDISSFKETSLEETVPTEENGSDDSSCNETALEETVPVPTEKSGCDYSSCNETANGESVPVTTEESGTNDFSCSEKTLIETVSVSTCRDIETDVPKERSDKNSDTLSEWREDIRAPSLSPHIWKPKYRFRLFKPVELHQASQPWKAKKGCSTNDLTRKAKSILNKISVENFEKLIIDLNNLNVEGEKDASHLSNLLFQKAVEDPTYAFLYAKVCKELMDSFFVVVESSNSEDFDWIVNFRFILAMTAKQEFGKVLQEISGEPNNSQRRHCRGVMNFLAELVNQNVITCKVANKEILDALKSHWLRNVGDYFALECMCKFLSVAGRTLDYSYKHRDDEYTTNINMYYEFLQILVEPTGLNSRVRFMIIDLLQLRRIAWFKVKK